MLYKIALITLLCLTTTISARSLEGYKCREQTVLSDDPLTPLRTVRICGVMDYPTAPTNYYQTVPDIQGKVHPSSSTSNYFNRRYSSSDAWPSQDQVFQRTFSPTFPNWPAQPVQTESNESEKLLLNFFKTMQPLNEPKYAAATTNYPSNTISALNADKLMEVQRFNEQSVNEIAEDATEIKSSVTDVVAQMKNMLGTLLLTRANKAEESDININVNLKLDPSFQSILQDFLELAKTDMESSKNVESDESAESVRADNNNDQNDDNNVAAIEDNSEESATQDQTDSEESLNESVDQEESEEEAKSSSEDLDTWLRVNFGPKLHHSDEDADNDNSEGENSSEKTEESFESWFNAVYRKYATLEQKDYETSEESRINEQESEEIVPIESVDSSNENNSHNEHDEWKIIEDNQKFPEVNTEDSHNVNDDDNDYDAFFVPTTMDPTQRDISVEYLANGDKYLYSTENNFNYDEISADIKLSCLLDSPSLYLYITCLKRNVEQKGERKNFLNFEIGNSLDSVESKESESNENEEIDSAASDSKESTETESATTDSSESKESGETEEAITDSSESKESGETEEATTDSGESKESGETEEATTDSGESKESGETEGATTDSSESNESPETETATTDSSESKESAETEAVTKGSSESRESAEGQWENNWYDYSKYSLI